MKAGVGIADILCGLCAVVGILAAVTAQATTGQGQHSSHALMDAQVAMLVNQGVGYLTGPCHPGAAMTIRPSCLTALFPPAMAASSSRSATMRNLTGSWRRRGHRGWPLMPALSPMPTGCGTVQS